MDHVSKGLVLAAPSAPVPAVPIPMTAVLALGLVFAAAMSMPGARVCRSLVESTDGESVEESLSRRLTRVGSCPHFALDSDHLRDACCQRVSRLLPAR